MTSPKVLKDKIFEKVINPYLTGVLQRPQSIEMHEEMLHIRDVEGPKKTGSMEARLEAMEQQAFKCQGMVERGLSANHMMITEFTSKHGIDANDIGKHLSRIYDRIDHLQAQIYDLQNQNWAHRGEGLQGLLRRGREVAVVGGVAPARIRRVRGVRRTAAGLLCWMAAMAGCFVAGEEQGRSGKFLWSSVSSEVRSGSMERRGGCLRGKMERGGRGELDGGLGWGGEEAVAR
ncbi:40S ribosomal protein S5-1 [Hordeum vulgare]|nr:40S ribosomal protein S5-1 [Hordeum vulgare]